MFYHLRETPPSVGLYVGRYFLPKKHPRLQEMAVLGPALAISILKSFVSKGRLILKKLKGDR